MASLSGTLSVGDVVYYPEVDLVSCGFIIERLKILKLIAPGGNPLAIPEIIWTYGNIGWYNNQREKAENKAKIYYHNRVFKTLEECILKLESSKEQFISELEALKISRVEEVEELKKILRMSQVESKEEIRAANKKLSMLRSLSVLDNLKQKKIIDSD